MVGLDRPGLVHSGRRDAAKDLSPKPVYEQLKRLIHEEWNTKASGITDSEGRFSLRGFCGNYRVLVSIPGKTIEKKFHLGRKMPTK